MFHCLFEQSGTFKNEFKKLGYEAKDYDILNDFGETDYIIDLFKEIESEYERERETIFTNMSEKDTIIAFFPCTRFENQIYMHFQGKAVQMAKWTEEKKLQYNMKLHEELYKNYLLITKMVLICMRKGIKLIIENPYSGEHYLTRYWSLQPKIIDKDRREMGDYFKKPTQYWFINCEPKFNFIFEGQEIKKKKTIHLTNNRVERSMISPEYANRFIREYII